MTISVPVSAVVDCGDPGTSANSQRTLSSTIYNFVVTYTCDEGYTLHGSNSRTCQSNGQWSGSVPQCIGKLVICLLCISFCYTIYHLSLLPTIPTSSCTVVFRMVL